jgi:hypothetical protein
MDPETDLADTLEIRDHSNVERRERPVIHVGLVAEHAGAVQTPPAHPSCVRRRVSAEVAEISAALERCRACTIHSDYARGTRDGDFAGTESDLAEHDLRMLAH